ncbi:phosphatase PAP2 family protein [Mesorhizobium sp. ES1-1]|uniref:phosphatase PAP2 family protein n=1 Tax=Mesorhizobium sp. ES1-1 TaxID=2876629 RepID=UPI001CCF13CE|nr:phosphatase PAP2 family protein [Mesorhizobium sp. ES1-1]MBZ9676670.1 phosphatase PAP2 family protein [Mesorhizobium sp. ES1-1]
MAEPLTNTTDFPVKGAHDFEPSGMMTGRCVVFAQAWAIINRALPLVRRDSGLYLLIAVYTFLGLGFLHVVGAADRSAYAVYFGRWTLLNGVTLPAVAGLVEFGLLIHRFDRRRGLAARYVFSTSRLAYSLSGLCLVMALMIFQGTFTSVKNGMAVWQGGFPFDVAHADIDAFLHFGVDPWRWLYMVAKNDFVRTVVEWNYNVLWFVFNFGALFFVMTSPRAASVRTRYAVCFMLVWIVIGNILAGLFLSAGPAFYGAVTGDTARFGEQLAFLAHGAESANSAVSYQHYLWTLHEAGQTGFGSGISAFPSVHVGLATLNALFVREYNRRLGAVAFVYVAFVAASSVYLAWHYAIDGYAAAAVAVLVYVLARKLVPADQPVSRLATPSTGTMERARRQAHSLRSATSSMR